MLRYCRACRKGLILLFVAGALPAQTPALFEYDRKAPFDTRVQETSARDGYRLSNISYANPDHGRTSGYLLVPDTKGSKPAIVWLHSGGPLQWMGDAVLLTRAGAICLLVDPPGEPSGNSAEEYRDGMIRAVVGIRRAVDLLQGRDDVDPQRIGYVGHSFGAMMGAVATSIDPRFAAAVYEVGLLGMSIHIGTSPHPWAAGIRKQLGPDLPNFLDTISVVDAKHYLQKAGPFPKLFQSARYDPGVPISDAEAFFDRATEPKQLKWYDTGHDVNDLSAIADRARFLAKNLKLLPVEALLRSKIASASSRTPRSSHPAGSQIR